MLVARDAGSEEEPERKLRRRHHAAALSSALPWLWQTRLPALRIFAARRTARLPLQAA